MIIKTTKKHWVNGYQLRMGWFKTYAVSLGQYALMTTWGGKTGLKMFIYKLIK
jgi:hypothetical protein